MAEDEWVTGVFSPLINECVRKWWYPTTMGLPTKNDQHLGCDMGKTHHLRKHPNGVIGPLHLTSDFGGPTLPCQAADVPTKAEALPARWDPSTPLVADKGASQLPLPKEFFVFPTWDLGRWFSSEIWRRLSLKMMVLLQVRFISFSTTLLFRFHVKIQGCKNTQRRRRLQMDPELVDQLVLFAKTCRLFAQQAVHKDKLNAQLR